MHQVILTQANPRPFRYQVLLWQSDITHGNCTILLLFTPTAVEGVRVFFCVSDFLHNISKTDAAGITKLILTHKCFTTTSGNGKPFTLKSKSQCQGHES